MNVRYHANKPGIFDIIEKDARKYCSFNQVEAVVHPGYLDSEIWFGSSFNLARMREIEILCDPDLMNVLNEFGYDLVNYHEFPFSTVSTFN